MRTLVVWSCLVAAVVLGPRGVTSAHAQAVNYFGFFDNSTCAGVSGWVYSPEQPYAAQQVQIFVDGVATATVTANGYRADVAAAGFGTGYYGFGWNFPTPYYGTHTLRARAVGSGADLYWSPRTITCAPPPVNYFGFLDAGTCTGASGWVWSPDQPVTTRQQVEILVDGVVRATVTANLNRPDVAAAGYGDGNYGYATTWPALAPGNHSVAARVAGTTGNLYGSPRAFTCSAPVVDNSTGTVQWQRTAIPGEASTPTIAMSNTGTTTWLPGRYLLKSLDTWSTTGLATSVAPGGNTTFTTPAVVAGGPGMTTRSWRMTADGVGFGATASASQVVSTVPTVYALYYDDHLGHLVFFCSATLIGDRTLVTAAHCAPENFQAFVYRQEAAGDPTFVDYGTIHNYPGFDSNQFANPSNIWGWLPDLAVVTLYNPHPDLPRARIRHNTAPAAGFTTAGFGRSFAHRDGGTKHFGFHSKSGEANWYFQQLGVPTVNGVPDQTAIVCKGDSGGAVFNLQDVNAATQCLTGVISYNIPGPGGPTGINAELTPEQCVTGTWHTKLDWVWITGVANDGTIGDCF